MNNYLISKLGSHYTKVIKAPLFILYLQKMYTNIQKKFRLTKTYFNHNPCDHLNQVIHSDFACENINNLLSIYGLNPNSYSNFSNKLWNHTLIIFFWIGLFKFFIHFLLDPIADYKLCIYLVTQHCYLAF